MEENAPEGESVLQGRAEPEQHPEQPGWRLGGCGRSFGGRGLTCRGEIMQKYHSLLASISGLGSLAANASMYFLPAEKRIQPEGPPGGQTEEP